MSEPPGAAGNPPADVGCPSISRSDWPDKWRSGNGDIGWRTIAHCRVSLSRAGQSIGKLCRFVLGVPEPRMNTILGKVIRQSCWCSGMQPSSVPRIQSVVSQGGTTSRYIERE
jgi:hypothetical protein